MGGSCRKTWRRRLRWDRAFPRPLGLVAIGLVLVVLDVRTEYYDALPDPLGWVLVALGAWRLSLRAAGCLAVSAAALSVPGVHLPHRFVVVDPVTGEELPHRTSDGGSELLVFQDVSGWRLMAMALTMAAAAATLWMLLTGFERRARVNSRSVAVPGLRLLRWLVPAAWPMPYLAVVAVAVIRDSGEFDPVWNGGLELVALAGIVSVAVLAIFLVLESGRAWALPDGSARPSRWSP